MAKQQRYINRELAWLAFNARVLQEAQDPTVPLLERLKFLGIFSNNLDEFYRVRIASLKRIMKLGSGLRSALHVKPSALLDDIQRIVLQQNRSFESTYRDIRHALRRNHIDIINERKLTVSQQTLVREFFRSQVRPALVPIMLDQAPTFPMLKDSAIYLAIKISQNDKPRNTKYAVAEIPTTIVSRFFILPSTSSHKVVILLDDIIRFCLPDLFPNQVFDTIEAYTVKLTRDQELDLDSDISQSLMEKLEKSIKARQKGNPVRFVYDKDIAPDLLDYLKVKMKLHKYDNLIPAGRYHNFKDFIGFPDLGIKELVNPELKPIPHPAFTASRSAFDAIRAQDIMLHYPYQSFTHFIDLLREAAMDPAVKSIRMTLYRAARKSHVMNALINAARNGKAVTLVVELQARFDEEANIHWAKELADEGIHVIYGVPQLKVHSKVVLIERMEQGKRQYYANLATGNYNERTAAMYCDDALFTADKRITTEVKSLFEFFEKNYLVKNYKHLILSPNRTRAKLTKLIDHEIKNARLGKASGITLKLNSLVDEHIIDWLYKASGAGVPVNIMVRGMCALIPGVPGMSENIRVMSIIDRYLEHSRVYVFENAGKPQYFISSADMMTRNLDQRIEVTCPIYDQAIQQELQMMLDIQFSDTVKARRITEAHAIGVVQKEEGLETARTHSRSSIRSQLAIYAMIRQKTAIVRSQNNSAST